MAGPPFFELARTLRAHRRFDDRPVSDDDLALVLDAATRAPSAENRQPWHFVVVRDDDRRARLAALMAELWDRFGRDHSRPRLEPGLFDDVDRGFADGLVGAPVFVVVCGDHRLAAGGLESSVFPATQNLLLAVHQLGMGAVLTTIAAVDPGRVRAVVDAPEDVEPMAIVPIGWPARALGPSRRAPLSTRVSLETYGEAWPAR